VNCTADEKNMGLNFDDMGGHRKLTILVSIIPRMMANSQVGPDNA
jgi:hypothetical protein